MFSPAPVIKRASDPHLKSSTCGTAAASLKAFYSPEKWEASRSKHEGPQHSQLFWVSSLSSIKRKDELKPKGTHEHLFVVANLSLFTEENGHVDVCVFVRACLPSVSRKASDLSLQLLPLILHKSLWLSSSTCSWEIVSSSCLFTSFCSTHRKRRECRGGVCREFNLSVFEGINTPYFCIIHITPHTWSISRLQQGSGAISCKDATAADTSRQTHTKQQDPSLLLPGKGCGFLWGRLKCGCI